MEVYVIRDHWDVGSGCEVSLCGVYNNITAARDHLRYLIEKEYKPNGVLEDAEADDPDWEISRCLDSFSAFNVRTNHWVDLDIYEMDIASEFNIKE